MSDIQNISITSTQTVQQPKPHTTYTIQVSTPTRTWTVDRRYNDFTSLQAELVTSTGKEPPSSLPGKHVWSLTRAVYDEKIIRERRVLLQQYLRSILTTKDSRWRDSFGWSDFLAVPQARAGSSSTSAQASSSGSNAFQPAPEIWTPATWLSEHGTITSLLRSARASLLKRDALAGMGDAAGSRTAAVEAKRVLRDVGPRVDMLERALKGGANGMAALGEGEKRRREEMVDNVSVERDGLGRMAEAGVRTGMAAQGSGFGSGANANASAGTGANTGSAASSKLGMPGSFPANSAFGGQAHASGRFFGQPPPSETDETRPLDDRGLLQLQQSKMDNQDSQLSELSKLLRVQRQMGEEIHQEIEEQSEMLDELTAGVDKTQGKLGRAKRQMNRLG